MLGRGTTIQVFPEGKGEALAGCAPDKQHQDKNRRGLYSQMPWQRVEAQEPGMTLGQGCRKE